MNASFSLVYFTSKVLFNLVMIFFIGKSITFYLKPLLPALRKNNYYEKVVKVAVTMKKLGVFVLFSLLCLDRAGNGNACLLKSR